MELKSLEQLNKNPKNPRKISKQDFANLKQSIAKFGDLSGIVFNRTTGRLVGGHQRIEAFNALPSKAQVIITQNFDQPNQVGTVALGYVDYNNEQYAYREVQWDEATETAANIAANRIQGEFDLDLLAELNQELAQLENADEMLKLTGQSDKELERLNKMAGIEPESEVPDEGTEPEEPTKLEFALTKDQREIVEEAIGSAKVQFDMAAETNSSINGNALYFICREYLDRLHGLIDDNPPIAESQNQPEVVQSTAQPTIAGSEERLDATPQNPVQ